MDNGSHNFQETPQNEQQPQRAPKKPKNSGWKQIAIVAVVAALIGGGVGGGTAYLAINHSQSLGVPIRQGKPVRPRFPTFLLMKAVHRNKPLRRLKALSFPL